MQGGGGGVGVIVGSRLKDRFAVTETDGKIAMSLKRMVPLLSLCQDKLFLVHNLSYGNEHASRNQDSF